MSIFEKIFRGLNKAHVKYLVVGGLEIPVASIDDILKMKRKAGRENDARDIQALLEIKGIE